MYSSWENNYAEPFCSVEINGFCYKYGGGARAKHKYASKGKTFAIELP